MSEAAALCGGAFSDLYAVVKDFAGPAATICAAAAAATLAFIIQRRQWRTAQDKLNLDLFDKRYPYFLAAQKFLGSLLAHADMKDEALREFDLAMVGHKFVFDAKIVRYIETLRNVAFEAKFAQIAIADLNSPERPENIRRKHDALLWLHERFQELESVFATQIGIRNTN